MTSLDTSSSRGSGVGGAEEHAIGEIVELFGGGDAASSCQPVFSGGYSSVPCVVCTLFPALPPIPGEPTRLSFSYCKASRNSFGMPMYFDSRFDLSSLEDGAPVDPSWLTSHQRLDGRPLELFSSNASLTLMLGIGESEGI